MYPYPYQHNSFPVVYTYVCVCVCHQRSGRRHHQTVGPTCSVRQAANCILGTSPEPPGTNDVDRPKRRHLAHQWDDSTKRYMYILIILCKRYQFWDILEMDSQNMNNAVPIVLNNDSACLPVKPFHPHIFFINNDVSFMKGSPGIQLLSCTVAWLLSGGWGFSHQTVQPVSQPQEGRELECQSLDTYHDGLQTPPWAGAQKCTDNGEDRIAARGDQPTHPHSVVSSLFLIYYKKRLQCSHTHLVLIIMFTMFTVDGTRQHSGLWPCRQADRLSFAKSRLTTNCNFLSPQKEIYILTMLLYGVECVIIWHCNIHYVT